MKPRSVDVICARPLNSADRAICEGLGITKPKRGLRAPARKAKPKSVSVDKIFAWTPKIEDTIVDVNEGRRSYSADQPVVVSHLDTPRGGYWIVDGHHRVVEAVERGDKSINVVLDEHLPRIERTGGAYSSVLDNRVNVSKYVRAKR